MDYGKFKYENAQKAREARRNQTNVIIKEMKLRPKIDAHDYETKKGHVVRFLKAGDKVKITIMFRGREQHRPELGFRLLQRLAEDVTELGFVESVAQAGRPQHDHGARPAQEEGRGQGRAAGRQGRAGGRAGRRGPRSTRSARRAHAAGTPWPRRRSAAAPRTSIPRSRPDEPARSGSRGRVRTVATTTGTVPPRQQRRTDSREEETMPKNKTHSGASKRFKVTGSGKLLPREGRQAPQPGEEAPRCTAA